MSRYSNLMRNMLITGVMMILMSSYIFSKSSVNTDRGNGNDNDHKKAIEKKAAYLASDLQAKISLTDIQTSEVKSALINYLTNVSIINFTQRAGAREKTYDVKSDPPSDLQDLNLSYDDNTIDNLRNADTDANLKINNVISRSQMVKWNEVKDSWWSKVIAAEYEEDE